ncbi:hypothetical protein [Pedobacter faecalis]|uniref:hypothetical protein n=1 Tax=Pedobacter faecalis TaxID=3041495 RepID=UPI00254FE490|nr:hypothetical protein [Pedobacter sp. ELA7]
MGREIRRVPEGWEHPKENGRYIPMFDTFYLDALNDWLKEHNAWQLGTHADLIGNPDRKIEYPFYAMWGGNPPDVESYHTRLYSHDELTHIQLYESTSEGTPLSPVFHKDDFDKLCEWAAANATTFAHFKASKEDWMKMLGDGIVYHTQGNVTFM